MKFYKMFFSLALALVLQNVITLSINLADNIMLGAYSETALAGVAAVNQVQFIYQQVMLALGEAMVMLASQYWGKGQREPMRKAAASAMRMALSVGTGLFLIMSFFPQQVMHIFTADAEIVQQGAGYISVIRFSYLFFAVTMILLAILRSMERVKIAFSLSVITLFVNTAINYVLIYGKLGFPSLGVYGAAIGTVMARIIELTILIIYMYRNREDVQLKVGHFRHIDKMIQKDYIKVAVPMLAISGMWGLATAMQTIILGHMTTAAIAANSVASTLFLVVKSVVTGMSAAAAVVIGKTIGYGDMNQVKDYSCKLQKLFAIWGILGGILLFVIRTPILGIYDLAPETRELANQFLIVLSIAYIGMGYQMPVNDGIIRGGGSPEFVVKVNLISIWVIVIPLSFLLAFVVKASPLIVICCLNSDQIFKCIPVFLKVNYGRWAKKLTREI